LARLERAGATLVAADLPGVGELSLQAFAVVAFFEAPVDLAAYLDENDTGVTLEELVAMIASPDVLALFQLAGSVTARLATGAVVLQSDCRSQRACSAVSAVGSSPISSSISRRHSRDSHGLSTP
jgi:hypothetical protein